MRHDATVVRRCGACIPGARRLLGQRRPLADTDVHSDARRLGHTNFVAASHQHSRANAERNGGADSDAGSRIDRGPCADAATSYADAVRHAYAAAWLADGRLA